MGYLIKELDSLVYRYRFKIIGKKTIPKGEPKVKCDFCGGWCRHYLEIERNDGIRFRVGKTCFRRAHLDLG